jgi:hypothetical protein
VFDDVTGHRTCAGADFKDSNRRFAALAEISSHGFGQKPTAGGDSSRGFEAASELAKKLDLMLQKLHL